MHIVIGLITALAGLLWALNRLQNEGVDLNAFNPFLWMRRRNWEKQLGTKPMHGLTESMDAAALLLVSVACEDGVITREAKMEILNVFQQEFGLDRSSAISLFSSSNYMLKDVSNMPQEVRNVLKPCKDKFEQSHIDKLLAMLNNVASMEGPPTSGQLQIIEEVVVELKSGTEIASNW